MADHLDDAKKADGQSLREFVELYAGELGAAKIIVPYFAPEPVEIKWKPSFDGLPKILDSRLLVRRGMTICPLRAAEIAAQLPPDIGPNVALAESLAHAEQRCEADLYVTPIAARAMLARAAAARRRYRVVSIIQGHGQTSVSISQPCLFGDAQEAVDACHRLHRVDTGVAAFRCWMIELPARSRSLPHDGA